MNNQAPMDSAFSCALPSWARRIKDVLTTLCLWAYFTGFFLGGFFLVYLGALIFSTNRSAAIQGLNNFYFRGFFFLCRRVAPRHRWQIDNSVRRIRSAIVISNHISYLDPILLIALFPRFTTIAKDRLFSKPIFGRMLVLSGFLPSGWRGSNTELLLDSWETLPTHLQEGGNLVVFPEGTRSRDGDLGKFNKGIFKIARFYQAPICLIAIRNTNKLFKPGKFIFNTCASNTISVELVEEMHPNYADPNFSIQGLVSDAHAKLERHLKRQQP